MVLLCMGLRLLRKSAAQVEEIEHGVPTGHGIRDDIRDEHGKWTDGTHGMHLCHLPGRKTGKILTLAVMM